MAYVQRCVNVLEPRSLAFATHTAKVHSFDFSHQVCILGFIYILFIVVDVIQIPWI